MRSITTEEQKVIRKLIEWQSDGQSIRLGEVLLKLYPIEYIKPSEKKDEFYKNALEISFDYNNTSLSKILEAINIIDLLIKNDYLVAKEFFANDNIGKEKADCDLPEMEHSSSEEHYVHTSLMNYYNYNLWNLLNCYYYVTNSLIDFAKDFKTVEQRRFEEQLEVANDTLVETKNTLAETKKSLETSQEALKVSYRSFWIALATLLGTILFGLYQSCSQQEIDSEQINTIISSIKEQKSITIDNAIHLQTDTFNVKVIQDKKQIVPQQQPQTKAK